LGKLLDKKRYPGPSGWGLCVRLTFSPCKNLTVSTLWQNQGGCFPKTGWSTIDEELYDGYKVAFIFKMFVWYNKYSSICDNAKRNSSVQKTTS
jgi:hypothetical protein